MKNTDLSVTNQQLTSENELLKSQCNEHSKHCLLLIKENKRLMEKIDHHSHKCIERIGQDLSIIEKRPA